MENKNKRNEFVAAKINKSEYDKIKSCAEKCGMTVSRYMRETALGYEPRHTLTEKEISTLEKLQITGEKFKEFANRFKDLDSKIENGDVDVNNEETENKIKSLHEEFDEITNMMKAGLIELNRYGRSKRNNPECKEGAGLCQV